MEQSFDIEFKVMKWAGDERGEIEYTVNASGTIIKGSRGFDPYEAPEEDLIDIEVMTAYDEEGNEVDGWDFEDDAIAELGY